MRVLLWLVSMGAFARDGGAVDAAGPSPEAGRAADVADAAEAAPVLPVADAGDATAARDVLDVGPARDTRPVADTPPADRAPDPDDDGGGAFDEATLVITPPAFSFPVIAPNSVSAPQSFVVTNLGRAVSGAVVFDLQPLSAFHVKESNCGQPLRFEESCEFRLRFAPKEPGATSGRLAVAAQPGGQVQASLAGTAQGPAATLALAISPELADFPVTSTSPSAVPPTKTFTVTNTGTFSSGPLTVVITGSDIGDFAKAEDTCVTGLEPGASCLVVVRFRPTKSGLRHASLEARAGDLRASATLTGTGIRSAPRPARSR